jgi:hypothetical protein
MVKKVVSPARISVVNLVFLICLSLSVLVFWLKSSHGVITYMATAIKAEYATKCRSTNIAVQRLERACDSLHSVNRRARNGVEKWWTTRWQLVYVVLKVGSGAVTCKKRKYWNPRLDGRGDSRRQEAKEGIPRDSAGRDDGYGGLSVRPADDQERKVCHAGEGP